MVGIEGSRPLALINRWMGRPARSLRSGTARRAPTPLLGSPRLRRTCPDGLTTPTSPLQKPAGAAADCESARQREVRRAGQIGGSRKPRSRTSFASTTVVTFFLSPPGYPGDLPCPAKGAAIKSHNDEDQSTLQRDTLGVRQERYGKAELH